jgi:hypothetical protein
MENLRFALVQLRVTLRERDRWRRCADAEDMRLSELMREAIRAHVRELERHRASTPPAPPVELAAVTR